MHANDNEPAYFSRAELDRALVLKQRRRMIARRRKRALAAGRRPPSPLGHEPKPSTWHYEPRPLLSWPRSWDDMSPVNQYGILVFGTLGGFFATIHLVHFMITG